MTVTVRNRPGLIVPAKVQRQARLKIGELLEFRVSGGVITILPKLPNADDEYTSSQRRTIDTRLAAARKGPYHGPFETADAAIKFLNKEIRNRKAPKRKTTKS
jgi:hypothetical protein